jgi:hypothetical protein
MRYLTELHEKGQLEKIFRFPTLILKRRTIDEGDCREILLSEKPTSSWRRMRVCTLSLVSDLNYLNGREKSTLKAFVVYWYGKR